MKERELRIIHKALIRLEMEEAEYRDGLRRIAQRRLAILNCLDRLAAADEAKQEMER